MFPKEEFQNRLDCVEAAMPAAGLDALVAYAVKNQPGPVAYLCGFEPHLGLHDVAFFVVAPGGSSPYALITNAFWEHPQERPGPGETYVTSEYARSILDLIPAGARRIGIAGYRFFPMPVYLALQTALPHVQFVDATHLLMEIAALKSQAEIEAIRRCIQITDAGGEAFLRTIGEGVNERTVLAEVERALLLAGADGLSYATQVYSGPQVAICVGFSRDRTLARGEQVQVDCGARYRSYRGDLSRVTTIGKPSPEVLSIMETTARMYEAMFALVRPGAAIADIANIAVETATRAGQAPYLYRSPNHPVGFVGHGIGCWYHEYPEIHPEAAGRLEANMVVVLEPILGRPGVGGAKIEDAVLVTNEGAERLSSLTLRPWLG
jgi:Xaa-Pro aminopeptidase